MLSWERSIVCLRKGFRQTCHHVLALTLALTWKAPNPPSPGIHGAGKVVMQKTTSSELLGLRPSVGDLVLPPKDGTSFSSSVVKEVSWGHCGLWAETVPSSLLCLSRPACFGAGSLGQSDLRPFQFTGSVIRFLGILCHVAWKPDGNRPITIEVGRLLNVPGPGDLS